MFSWVKHLKEENIGCADPFSLVETLGDPVLIREWVLQKLPKDDFSISNAIILSKSLRFPLFVDPQVRLWFWTRKISHCKNFVRDREIDGYETWRKIIN